jgi:hypothetical protein
LRRRTLLVVGVVVAIALAIAVILSSSPTALPASTNIYVAPVGNACKNTTSFSCTIVLNAKQGSVSVSDVKSVTINGTNSQLSVTATGSSVTIVASFPTTTSCVYGCPPSAATDTIPHVGSVVIDLSDGTMISVQVGLGGIIP